MTIRKHYPDEDHGMWCAACNVYRPAQVLCHWVRRGGDGELAHETPSSRSTRVPYHTAIWGPQGEGLGVA